MHPARSPSLSRCPSLGAGPVWTGPAYPYFERQFALTLTTSSTGPVEVPPLCQVTGTGGTGQTQVRPVLVFSQVIGPTFGWLTGGLSSRS